MTAEMIGWKRYRELEEVLWGGSRSERKHM